LFAHTRFVRSRAWWRSTTSRTKCRFVCHSLHFRLRLQALTLGSIFNRTLLVSLFGGWFPQAFRASIDKAQTAARQKFIALFKACLPCVFCQSLGTKYSGCGCCVVALAVCRFETSCASDTFGVDPFRDLACPLALSGLLIVVCARCVAGVCLARQRPGLPGAVRRRRRDQGMSSLSTSIWSRWRMWCAAFLPWLTRVLTL
jgi:hypothetical protein